ncbi:hypothetical protein BX600DRAFT_448775 [Xylariales sp. PMI_506]|nr:hypothetical protein BX600DRAFT_448775 [Xylariales sp. PMI_506]
MVLESHKAVAYILSSGWWYSYACTANPILGPQMGLGCFSHLPPSLMHVPGSAVLPGLLRRPYCTTAARLLAHLRCRFRKLPGLSSQPDGVFLGYPRHDLPTSEHWLCADLVETGQPNRTICLCFTLVAFRAGRVGASFDAGDKYIASQLLQA